MAVTALCRARRALLVLAVCISAAPTLPAQARLTSPREQLGWNVGDDYRLATYTQLTTYWQKLDSESDRLDRKSTRLNSSHSQISYAVFCLKKKISRPPRADACSTMTR